ncbi:MAG: nicotinate (nicotinamide) nucleotide adenylyltransferase [Gemmatimonadetes bacterium 13_1_40CM_70_15]|nr:MAG: nicotinate (nicotinamide) nucleotide adenylyltransferase [Gemmatimonadetes bacterium 13_1_40CM_70_15]
MDALFGGSFDPVHVGHLIVAEAVADALGARIRFLPAREQPFKRAAHVATPEQRAEMLALAVAGNPRCTVERIELELPVPSYTVRTLRALADREGERGGGGAPRGKSGNRFTFLLGADAARDLPEWYEVEALPQLADVVVFARPGAAIPSHRLITRVIEVPTVEVSATAIRARVAAGRSIRYWVPDAVREYIAAHGLYR